MTEVQGLQVLLGEDVYDLLALELQIREVLPVLVRKTGSLDLKNEISRFQARTEARIRRLQLIFDDLRMTFPRVDAGNSPLTLEEFDVADLPLGPMLDSAVLACARQLERQTLAQYGAARLSALTLSFHRTATLLSKSIEEEVRGEEHLSLLVNRCLDPRRSPLRKQNSTLKKSLQNISA